MKCLGQSQPAFSESLSLTRNGVGEERLTQGPLWWHWLTTWVAQSKLCCSFGMLVLLPRMKKWNLSTTEDEDVTGRPPAPASPGSFRLRWALGPLDPGAALTLAPDFPQILG